MYLSLSRETKNAINPEMNYSLKGGIEEVSNEQRVRKEIERATAVEPVPESERMNGDRRTSGLRPGISLTQVQDLLEK